MTESHVDHSDVRTQGSSASWPRDLSGKDPVESDSVHTKDDTKAALRPVQRFGRYESGPTLT